MVRFPAILSLPARVLAILVIGLFPLAGKESVLTRPPLQVSSPQSCAPKWQVIPSPNTESPSNVLADVAVVSATDAWAVGVFWGLGSPQALAEHWDGNAWTLQTIPFIADYSELYGVDALGANNVWAVGVSTNGTIVLHWDGEAWTSETLAGVGTLHKVKALAADDIWAVGYSIAHRDGNGWQDTDPPQVGNESNTLADLAVIGPDDIWAAGTYSNYDEGQDKYTKGTYVLHYDGNRWNTVPSPNTKRSFNHLTGIGASGANDIWAVGFTQDNGVETRPLVLHWTGSDWSESETPKLNKYPRALYDVIGPTTDNAIAVGYYGTPRNLRLALGWDGQGWNHIPTASTKEGGNWLVSVDGDPSTGIWAVGDVTTLTGGNDTLVERFATVVAKPQLLSPARGEAIAKPRVTLDWNDKECATRYELVLHQDSKDGTLIAQPTQLTASKFKVGPLDGGHGYFWRVRGCAWEICGKWSKWSNFSIQ